jgi:polar amino acid transport system substrate-binding protein
MRFLFRHLVLVFCLTSWPIFAQAACEKTINFAWNDYKPYSYRASSGAVTGLDVDLTRLILRQVGCQYAIQEIPAKRALKMLETGDIDLVAAASVTPEREAYGYFSAPYRSERIVMFVRRDDPVATAILTLDDALKAHLRVAAGNGATYGKNYDTLRDKFLAGDLLTLNASLEQRLQLLAGHRVDIVVEDEVAGASTAHDLGLAARLQVVGTPLSDEPVRLLLSRKSITPTLVTSIDQAIKTLQKTPAYAAILARHNTLDQ